MLRGVTPPPLLPPSGDGEEQRGSSRGGERYGEARDDGRRSEGGRAEGREGGQERKRKRRGEDDTAYEMRLASSKLPRHSASPPSSALTLRYPEKGTSNAPLVDERGHISLFPSSRPSPQKPYTKAKTQDDELKKRDEVDKRRKEYERDYTVKFSNAAGYGQSSNSAWYATGAKELQVEMSGRDVWGNEDPRRKEREANRVSGSDPLAAMRRGARMVRVVKEERAAWERERMKEVEGRVGGGGRGREGGDGEREGMRRRRRDRDGDGDEKRRWRREKDDESEDETQRRRRRRRDAEDRHQRRPRDRSRSRSQSRSPDSRRERTHHRSSRRRSRSPI